MKKTLLVISAFLFISLIVSGCCKCGKADENVMKGKIVIVGNEPFARAALSTEDNKIYMLECNEELQKEFIKKQGFFYAIKFDKIKEDDGLPTLIVKEAVLLNDKTDN